MRLSAGFKIGAILALLGVCAFSLWYRQSDEVAIPKDAQRAINEADINAAAARWHLAPLTNDAPETLSLDPKQTVRLAIGGLGMPDDEKNARLSDLVLNDLGNTPGLEMVDRQSLERVLHEQSLSLSELIRARDAVRIGALLHADWFLFGTTATADGTNASIVRLVDARSGVLINVGVLPQQGSDMAFAQALAGFISKSRASASHLQTHTYIALAAMEDLGVNNRLIHFPNDLRSYLMKSYQPGSVTVLEREYVDALLQEVNLDLAGLSSEDQTRHLPMQSACWMISGYYQSLENDGTEVETVLEINQIMGRRPVHKKFRGKPGPEVFQQIREAIDEQMKSATNLFFPTRRTEALIQMEFGKDMMQGEYSMPSPGMDIHFATTFFESSDGQLVGTEKNHRRHNLEEAIKAFQTVLILEPTNREAKLFVAECLENPTIDRREEAREIYRQLLEEPIDDKFVLPTEMSLMQTFNGLGPWVSKPWNEAAARRSNNPKTKTYFLEQAGLDKESRPVINNLDEAGAPAILAAAKSNLLVNLQDPHGGALGIFAQTFGTNDAAAAKALHDFLPELEARFPEKKFALQAGILAMQTDTNTDLLPTFRDSLTWCMAHRDEIPDSESWGSSLKYALLPWTLRHACFDISEKIIQYDEQEFYQTQTYPESEWLILALEYFQHEQWENALKIFQVYSNRPVRVSSNIRTCDQFNYYEGPLLTGRYAAACEEKLGRQHISDPGEFHLGKAVFTLDENSIFTADPSGIWIVNPAGLQHLDLTLKSKQISSLPMIGQTKVNCICAGPESIWVGTSDEGLVEISKVDGHYNQFRVQDGLLMDSIRQLQLNGDNLWIGYGGSEEGGFGRYDLSSKQFHSYTSDFSNDSYRPTLAPDRPDGPPRHPVTALSIEPDGDILALVFGKGLQHFQVKANKWETLQSAHGYTIHSMAVNESYAVRGVGISRNESTMVKTPIPGGPTNRFEIRLKYRIRPDQGALEFCASPKGSWQLLQDPDGIPDLPNVLAISGGTLWVGGNDYLACVDLAAGRVIKYCYFYSPVDRLLIVGDDVWAQIGGGLYRLSAR